MLSTSHWIGAGRRGGDTPGFPSTFCVISFVSLWLFASMSLGCGRRPGSGLVTEGTEGT